MKCTEQAAGSSASPQGCRVSVQGGGEVFGIQPLFLEMGGAEGVAVYSARA